MNRRNRRGIGAGLGLMGLTLAACGPGVVETGWPPAMLQASPAAPASGVRAELPEDVEVVPPAPGSPRAAWSGRWRGWAGNGRTAETGLVVERIEGDSAQIVYLYAGAHGPPYVRRFNAVFAGDELQAQDGQYARIAWKMRRDGRLAFLYSVEGGLSWTGGVLARENPMAANHVAWPAAIKNLQPAQPAGEAKAELPADLQIRPPAAGVPAELAKWSGVWSGTACAGGDCATKLAVEEVRPYGAAIVYAFDSPTGAPYATRARATFSGDEMIAELDSGVILAYRMRPDNVVEFLWLQGEQWLGGVLTKEAPPRPRRAPRTG